MNPDQNGYPQEATSSERNPGEFFANPDEQKESDHRIAVKMSIQGGLINALTDETEVAVRQWISNYSPEYEKFFGGLYGHNRVLTEGLANEAESGQYENIVALWREWIAGRAS